MAELDPNVVLTSIGDILTAVPRVELPVQRKAVPLQSHLDRGHTAERSAETIQQGHGFCARTLTEKCRSKARRDVGLHPEASQFEESSLKRVEHFAPDNVSAEPDTTAPHTHDCRS